MYVLLQLPTFAVHCLSTCIDRRMLMRRQVGDWAAALSTARAQQMWQDSLNNGSTCSASTLSSSRAQQMWQDSMNNGSTCSTSSAYAAAGPWAAPRSCGYLELTTPAAPGEAAAQLVAMQYSSSQGPASSPVGVLDVCGGASGAELAAAGAALTLGAVGCPVVGQVVQQADLAAAGCDAACLVGNAMAAPAGTGS
ncbi:hypothetical protein COO60DRAFT_286952 [Scenedesmus sp. NREL 46B-D3]|nr:hypothetical protein COO60DRAFT_286952 [Scenedesmus sp. NREL 46B-D3]